MIRHSIFSLTLRLQLRGLSNRPTNLPGFFLELNDRRWLLHDLHHLGG